ncbi:hypothetical protein KAU11_10205 [Candidatus Babeliales bacterium]|nr:hypothetical protein [Candidatus Babeliales bacterium]
MISAIDFDGVIAHYSGWKGSEHFGKPIEGAKEALQQLKNEGHIIIIYTARLPTEGLKEYLSKYNMPYDYINENPLMKAINEGPRKIPADIYIDDKGLTFKGNWTNTLNQIAKFKSWEPHEHCKEGTYDYGQPEYGR